MSMLPGFDCWSLVAGETGRTVVGALKIADRFWPRMVGLQFRRPLPPGHGLLLVPCASVHTLWLRFPLDLAMLGDGGEVLATRHGVRPWRGAIAPRGTRAVLEMTAGAMEIATGQHLIAVCRDVGARLPQSLAFLKCESIAVA